MSVEYTYILNTCGNINIIDPAINNFTGMVAYFAMAQNPDGWLICDGSTLNRFTYPNLFARIGYTYGGSGTFFKIPNLRGFFIRSWNWTGGVDPDVGRGLGSLQDHALQQMTGRIATFNNYRAVYGNTASGVFDQFSVSSTSADIADGGGSDARCYIDFDASRVANTSTETRPINICLQACIKY